MEDKKIDVNRLETILNKTIDEIKKSKSQLFEIVQDTRTEKEKLLQRLAVVQQEIKEIISKVDQLDKEYYHARKKLSEFSKNFKVYSEGEIQKSYEEAYQFQVQLFLAREREMQFKNNRNDLQLRLKSIDLTIERAENLVAQVGVIFDYLTKEMIKIPEVIESANLKQMFGLKIIQAQEEERKRVARDIHDGPAQSMANIVLRTEIAERLLNNQQIDLAILELKDLKAMIRQSLVDVRQIIFDLRPMALDDLGLLPTLRKFLPEMANRVGLKTNLAFKGRERRLPMGMEVAIFRLIQEIVNNVIKHAKATKVKVNVEYRDGHIKVVVQDDGVGFEKEEVMKKKKNFGLIGMKERIQLLEGECEIDSKRNIGTTIHITVPIKEGGENNSESTG